MNIPNVSTHKLVVIVLTTAIVASSTLFLTVSVNLKSGPNYSDIDIQSPNTNVSIDRKSNQHRLVDLSLIDAIRPYQPSPRPLLDQIVDGWNFTSSPQWLLNFAIIGFPKCGTSTLMHYFHQNKEVQIFKEERCDLGSNQQVRLVRDMYNRFPAGDFVKGIKCPSNLESDLALSNYGNYFPNTDFIVGIRHPVKWMESFYNHRVHNQYKMPPLQKVLVGCYKGIYHVCVQRAMFHVFLSALSKTNISQQERELFGAQYKGKDYPKYLWKGRVFLYDVDQLNDKNETKAYQFRKDLQNFLYLRKELPPMVWFKPGRKSLSDKELEAVNKKKVDICEDQYKEVRDKLLEISINASTWIREYFLRSPDVVVSNRAVLEDHLRTWHIDPCTDGGSYKTKVKHLNCTRSGCFLTP